MSLKSAEYSHNNNNVFIQKKFPFFLKHISILFKNKQQNTFLYRFFFVPPVKSPFSHCRHGIRDAASQQAEHLDSNKGIMKLLSIYSLEIQAAA